MNHSEPGRAAAIIPAGGAGLRMGRSLPKQFCLMAGAPVLVHTLRILEQVPGLTTVILVVPADHLDRARELSHRFPLGRPPEIVAGGRTRQDSVRAGLAALPAGIELVIVHDGARPLANPSLFSACLARAGKTGAAMAAIPVKDTLKEVAGHKIARTIDRQGLWQAQTPQAARRDLLEKAFAAADRDGFIGTDEASLLEHLGHPIAVVEGSAKNLKLTTPEDLLIAEALLMNDNQPTVPAGDFRIGHGYDAHRLVSGRPLVLGGITIPHDRGLLGHSDADVLTHALCDAILGAIGAGDIGGHFPDSDPAYSGISSLRLLARVTALAMERGYRLVNADVTVVAQRPKLAGHFGRMRTTLAACCRVAAEAINLKASTTEQMGFPGREEGIAAHAVALLGPLPRSG